MIVLILSAFYLREGFMSANIRSFPISSKSSSEEKLATFRFFSSVFDDITIDFV